jgi:hypothetical protein
VLRTTLATATFEDEVGTVAVAEVAKALKERMS